MSTLFPHSKSRLLYDVISCMVLAAVAGLLHCAPTYKPDDRIIPVYLGSSKQFTFPTEFSYPRKDPIVSTIVCAGLVALLPLLVILLCQSRNRNYRDFHVGAPGCLKGVLVTTIISVTLKQFVGGFRPYYIETCRPDLSFLTNLSAASNKSWWMRPSACTGKRADVLEALQGFPSGHAANSFAAAVFLALYLNAKLKLFSDLAPRVFDLTAVMTPLLIASLISGSQYVTHQHHAHEIFAGILIGIVVGTVAYRLRYAAIFDFRYNHIPLTSLSSTNNGILTVRKSQEFLLDMDEGDAHSSWLKEATLDALNQRWRTFINL